MDIERNAFQENFTNEKGVEKPQKGNFRQKWAFFTKNTCKIEVNDL